MSAPCLCESLTPPGNSEAYVNPNDAGDDVLTVGDWVQGSPGVSNARCVRDALDALMANQTPITIVIWDEAEGEGSHCDYHIAGFAEFVLEGYHLPNENVITGRFTRYVTPGTAVGAGSGYGVYRIMAVE